MINRGAGIPVEIGLGKRVPYRGPALLALGFRVFFLLGAVWAVSMVGLWALAYSRGWSIPSGFTPMAWHGREMLFGFVGAILAGFLLTAPGNWTGWPMPSGARLAAFVALWVAGRLAPYAHSVLPVALLASVDAAFFVALALQLFSVLCRFRLWKNLPFPVLLLLMGAANVLSYQPWPHPSGGMLGSEAMLFLVLVVIAIMGGRVIPGFTSSRFPDGGSRDRASVNRLALGLLIAAALADLCAMPPPFIAGLFAAAAVAHAVRLYGWFTRELLREPLLWILHVAYAWLVCGLVLKAAASLGCGSPLLARHAFTVGTIGAITLGMMCRITLGHTGRALVLPRGSVFAFGLITAAALLRVLLPLTAPSLYLYGVLGSAVCWIAAFGLYVIRYGPMLLRPRVDGRSG